MDGRQVNTRRTIHRLSGADKMVFFFLPTKLKRRRRRKKRGGEGGIEKKVCLLFMSFFLSQTGEGGN